MCAASIASMSFGRNFCQLLNTAFWTAEDFGKELVMAAEEASTSSTGTTLKGLESAHGILVLHFSK